MCCWFTMTPIHEAHAMRIDTEVALVVIMVQNLSLYEVKMETIAKMPAITKKAIATPPARLAAPSIDWESISLKPFGPVRYATQTDNQQLMRYCTCETVNVAYVHGVIKAKKMKKTVVACRAVC